MATLVYSDKNYQAYRVHIPTEYAQYIKEALQYAKEHYVDEFQADTPEYYWAHVAKRKEQIDEVLKQME